MYRVIKKVGIDCHHKLIRTRIDSPCRRDHGHRYEFEVTIVGNTLSDDVLVDFGDISQMVRVFDHQSWNDWLENPTAEIILTFVAGRIMQMLTLHYASTTKLEKISVWETPSGYVELIL